MHNRLARWLLWVSLTTLAFEPAATAEKPRSSVRAARAEVVAAPAAVEAKTSGTERELKSLAGWVAREKGQLSAELVEIESGRVIAELDAKAPRNPASATKILTAAAALSKLGLDFKFTTGVYGAIKDGVAARLVLRSNGDPSLRGRDLDELAQKLKDRGLTRVSGDIVVDQSAFDDKYVPPAFDQQPHEWAAFRAPVSAVAVDRNAFVIRVGPDPVAKRATVTIDPAGYVDLSNDVALDEKSKSRKLSIEMLPESSKLKVRIRGSIGARATSASFQRRIDNPRLYAGYVFKSALSRVGVTVEGGVGEGGKEEKRALVERNSEPVSALVRELGKNSDNFYAETLLKALGAKSSGRAGSSADGTSAVLGWLKEHDVDSSSMKFTNGSGLFEANRIPASTLVRTIAAAYKDSRIGSAFVDQLAQAGGEGTLKNRFRTLKQRQSVRAKTGTLARVHSLAGIVLAPSGRSPIAFAIVVNGIAGKQDEQRRRIDRVVERATVELWR